MTRTIQSQNLQVGMFVKIPLSWMKHPFLKNEFVITSQNQIRKILALGIKSIAIDIGKSNFDFEQKETKNEIDFKPAACLNIKDMPLIPPEFRKIIRDKNVPPVKKAEVVYNSSIDIMNKLLDNPTSDNIKEFKSGISDVVDLILTDSDTSMYLLNITSHDYYTYTHSVNVGVLSVLLLKSLFGRSDSHNMHELGAGFFLHDIGKVNIDSKIINKPGKLDDEEMAEIRKHPNYGFIILSEAEQLSWESKIIVMQHHERFDGTGYPKGLLGEDIHLYGRICSIADVYDGYHQRDLIRKNSLLMIL